MSTEAPPAGEAGLFRAVPRSVTLRQSVYEALVELVITGRFRPGQHLVETQLGRRLGVSRQPVREALHRLQAEGWIEIRPGEGAFVHVPTGQEIDELLDVRELLEMHAARLAAQRADTGQVARLQSICRQSEAAGRDGDAERLVAANDDFHRAVAGIAGNTVLATLAGIVARRARWHYRLVAPRRGKDSSGEHREIAEAIAAADPQRAAKAARLHVERTRAAFHRDATRQRRDAAAAVAVQAAPMPGAAGSRTSWQPSP